MKKQHKKNREKLEKKQGRRRSVNINRIDFRKLSHGFSLERRPRYNNTILWREAMDRDRFEIDLKRERL